ncbi:hypothetical protein A3H80_03755 [Candidatus Roizmanbacteria bacterium RIFCSPLOWO2_02_FULL_37_19]|uniref:Uncharacterized protein n=1 Tax=Candidatus Roizmanbacteria bacterium RIFCSPHIGHO2_02_FULL_37_24 TaxID=1802037 RepID=A0A1F7GWG0_9BACT|nr:MAG: hypothetical protein A2862_01845 [Candidatus Roizmanbacteria bacterium RIFCSPHIGHO2_01_FULL_38_41]OGK22916.1 MAG: hypothetical protein A3C24_03585 [Candidatus Roizmanbacteria bacterium RIFCSPHIGHO2_02_FULL_37_24]OGK33630.1 MAG: hypothetical protein A3E10_05200 [Candidatus Roizmanbacteria bacterium RIFCSPHIGHO2_12_FULL_37_23]OGK44979.1 MAG: hypothetical protein A2956_00350 [Candidatus Roizmanbacteria bacterium RIFCSPLOWO2_01_FULL_37_57]OGK55282.1 MAG: hypothetical protein A3H80_03755 [Ca
MEITINLLQQEKNYKRIENFLHIARMIVILFGAATFIALIVIFLLKRNISQLVDSKSSRKEQLLTELNQVQDLEAKVLLLNQKTQLMNQIVIQEPHYLDYYNTLKRYLPLATNSAQLGTITLDSKKSAQVQIEFAGIIPLSEFLGRIEEDDFKNSFKLAQISRISFSESVDEQLKLTLNVTFNE